MERGECSSLSDLATRGMSEPGGQLKPHESGISENPASGSRAESLLRRGQLVAWAKGQIGRITLTPLGLSALSHSFSYFTLPSTNLAGFSSGDGEQSKSRLYLEGPPFTWEGGGNLRKSVVPMWANSA